MFISIWQKANLCSCHALQPLCPSGKLNLSHQTTRTSIHEGGLRPASPSVLSHTMKWYIPIILVCQYGNALASSLWNRTMMSACSWGLVDSSILHIICCGPEPDGLVFLYLVLIEDYIVMFMAWERELIRPPLDVQVQMVNKVWPKILCEHLC